MRKFNRLQNGMEITDIYKTVGQPFKIINDRSNNPRLFIYLKDKWFNRKQVVKVSINDGVVSGVQISKEKPLKLLDRRWEV